MSNTSQSIAFVSLIGASIIHLIPIFGLFGTEQLQKLYGIDITDPNLVLLMRHRALLFGLLGLALIAAIFRPEIRGWAIGAGLVSTIAFVVLAFSLPNEAQAYNVKITGVIKADFVAIGLLSIAAVNHYFFD